MGIIEIVLVSVSLSMDAFAVSICKGISMKKMEWKKAIIVGLYFGIFQALMPALGYILGNTFETLITSIDHWIAFILLAFIGGKMIKESFDTKGNSIDDKVDFKTMTLFAIATSIDALAIGITFAFLNVNLIIALFTIGIIAFIFSTLGVKIGNKFGNKFGKESEFIGGLLLVLMGIKILLEHLRLL